MAMRRLAPTARSAALSAIRPQRLHNQRPLLLLATRPISVMPWRKGSAEEKAPVPVYFPQPPAGSRLKPIRRFVGRVLFTTATVFVCWTVFYVIVLEPLFDWAEDEWDALSEKEKQEMAEESDEGPDSIVFLPMPFSTIEVNQPPYLGSDPEWQEFAALSRNTQGLNDIRNKLAETIRQAIAKNGQYLRILGGKDITTSHFWLEVIFPNRPPPKHYVAGISIEDDGVYWAHRPIDTLAANHLSLAIYPAAVAKATWTFVRVLGKGILQDTAVFLGIAEPISRPQSWETTILKRMQEQDTAGRGSNQITGSGNRELQDLNKTLQSAVPLGEMLPPSFGIAMSAAMVTFAKSWKPVRQGPNPGCFKVDGLIQFSGKRAYMSVLVSSWYDPKQKKFVDIQTQLRHILPFKQRPASR